MDHVAEGPAPVAAPYVGRRRAVVVEERPEPVVLVETPAPVLEAELSAVSIPERDVVDTATIERVLAALEPVDHSTDFAHEPTTQLPLLRAEPPSGGKRRATKHSGGRGPLFKGLPSLPVLMGVAALAVSIGGAVTVNDATPASSASGGGAAYTHSASALGGSSGQGTVAGGGNRQPPTTRDSDRTALGDAAGHELEAAAEATARQRDAALSKLAGEAEKRAKVIAKDLWVYPLEPVVLTARFGQYGLWASYHTGLDFNGETGDQIHAIANGEVISAQYDGSYGNRTIVRLEDGTELWYCHQSAFMVSVGDTVRAGEVIGLVGATGHVTGSHLHVEVHPGGGDAVDPYTAMQQHGLF